jgi:uncharacterized protein (TIGR03032 family)
VAGNAEGKGVKAGQNLSVLWAKHSTEWRDPAQITSQWREASAVDFKLLEHKVRGAWWEVLEKTNATLLITREYEHLVMAMCVANGRPRVSYLPLPHPSGIAVDRRKGVVYLASTRNPNQIYDLVPVTGSIRRLDSAFSTSKERPLIPVRSRFFPGCLYLHDLALINDTLLANAVGENAVVRVDSAGTYQRAWWPRCVEVKGRPRFGQNYIQLNSIAAGKDLSHSFFSASTDRMAARRPGHLNFPVDKRGVIFSGATREPVAHGLTRPHSVRFFRSQLWVDNSGYGEVGPIHHGAFTAATRLRGWTRGLCFCAGIAFAGTSRVIPRFRRYAPGVDPAASECGLHAIDPHSGKVLGSLIWPRGNQVFGIDWLPTRLSFGFPFTRRSTNKSDYARRLFYTFQTNSTRRP